jgi:hypothetical protein
MAARRVKICSCKSSMAACSWFRINTQIIEGVLKGTSVFDLYSSDDNSILGSTTLTLGAFLYIWLEDLIRIDKQICKQVNSRHDIITNCYIQYSGCDMMIIYVHKLRTCAMYIVQVHTNFRINNGMSENHICTVQTLSICFRIWNRCDKNARYTTHKQSWAKFSKFCLVKALKKLFSQKLLV